MEVSCLQENLARGLSIVNRAVATRSTLPVLSNIYLGTDGGRLKLAATNLEIGITCWVGAKVESEGATTVPARLFSDLVNQSPPERIEMALHRRGEELRYRCAQVEATIKGIDAGEFPIIPTAEGEGAIHVPPGLLQEMINQVAFAAATDDSRPILTGVLMDFNEDQLTLAAADGFRLSVRTARLEAPVAENTRVIVPARALNELARVIGDQEAPVAITVTPNRNQVLFHLENVDLVSQLIEGNFPDYRQIIPKGSQTTTVVDSAALHKAVRRAYIFAHAAANIVRLSIAAGQAGQPSQLTIRAEAAEIGDNVEALVAQVEGPEVEIAFNARYLLDVLGVIGAAQTALETSSSSSPGIIRPVGGDGFTHVVMPMHIGAR
ncbi:MAG TPA: DNA polymerase III subunit beta [Ardenticatenaceae bacterium]|nr:DNA polymerase III subunit beta [Ardenticatenaceae bacterium]